MKGQRPKLTLAERRKRAARNERRGRTPARRPIAYEERGGVFRYGGVVVRVFRGRIAAPIIHGRPVLARKGAPPRAAMGFAPLPRRLREQIAATRADRQRRKRLSDMGIKVPAGDVYQPANAASSGAAR